LERRPLPGSTCFPVQLTTMFLLRRNLRVPATTLRQYVPRRTYTFERPLLEELHERGLIAHATNEHKLQAALEERCVLYSGIDPTAKMLHVGHMVPLMTLLHFQLRGHRVLSVVRGNTARVRVPAEPHLQIGGATGLVGDPSGRTTERPTAARERIAENVVHLKQAVARFFEGARTYAQPYLTKDKKTTHPEEILDNLSWWKDVSFLDFLRDVGVHARMSSMLARDRRVFRHPPLLRSAR
jgi:tyrosyl-tRNA synthetase